jgi:hypothetical protein
MTFATARKYVIDPAIRQRRKGMLPPLRAVDNLQSLGIGEKEMPGLTEKIHGMLREQGWRIEPKYLKRFRPTARIGDLTRLIAHRAVVSAPKTCPNGHPQAYPGQIVCGLDGLPFE